APLLEGAGVVLTAQEPQQLLDHAAEEDPLGRDEREARLQVEAHLVAEHAARAGPGAVGLRRPVLEHVPQEVLVGRRDERCGHRAMVSRRPPSGPDGGLRAPRQTVAGSFSLCSMARWVCATWILRGL